MIKVIGIIVFFAIFISIYNRNMKIYFHIKMSISYGISHCICIQYRKCFLSYLYIFNMCISNIYSTLQYSFSTRQVKSRSQGDLNSASLFVLCSLQSLCLAQKLISPQWILCKNDAASGFLVNSQLLNSCTLYCPLKIYFLSSNYTLFIIIIVKSFAIFFCISTDAGKLSRQKKYWYFQKYYLPILVALLNLRLSSTTEVKALRVYFHLLIFNSPKAFGEFQTLVSPPPSSH